MTDYVSVLQSRTDTVSMQGTVAASLAPTLASLNFSLGDINGGGQAIVATGTNCLTVTSVNIFGNVVAPTSTTPTTVTFPLPAHASGTGTVSLTGPGGTSGTLAFEYWSPLQVAGVTRFFDSSLGVTSAAGAVSAWVDAANAKSFTQAVGVNKPSLVANAFGTMPGIQFVPEQWLFKTAGADEAAMNPFSLFAVAKSVNGRSVVTNAPYNTSLTILGGSGWGSFGIQNGGVGESIYNRPAAAVWGAGLANGVPHIFGVTADAVPNFQGYIDGVSVGAPVVTGDKLFYWDHIGDGYTNVDGFDGTLGALFTCAATAISVGDLAKSTAWARQRFGTP